MATMTAAAVVRDKYVMPCYTHSVWHETRAAMPPDLGSEPREMVVTTPVGYAIGLAVARRRAREAVPEYGPGVYMVNDREGNTVLTVTVEPGDCVTERADAG